MGDIVDTERGTYRGQPYERKVSINYADKSSIREHDSRRVEVRTRHSMLAVIPSADVRVTAVSREPIESYEKNFLWWTYDSHEPRPVEEHVEDVMNQFKQTVDNRLKTYKANELGDGDA